MQTQLVKLENQIFKTLQWLLGTDFSNILIRALVDTARKKLQEYHEFMHLEGSFLQFEAFQNAAGGFNPSLEKNAVETIWLK